MVPGPPRGRVVAVGGGELVGRQIALALVGTAQEPHGHVIVVGPQPFPHQVDVVRAWVHLDAHVLPVLGHQFADRHVTRPLQRDQYLDRQHLAVGPQAETVAAALQAHFVEQPVGGIGIVLRVAGRPLLLVEGVLGIHRRLPRDRKTEEQHLVDLLAVDRQRHRLPEAHVLKDLAQARILVREVEGIEALGAGGARPHQRLVVACFLVLLEQREVGSRQSDGGHRQLAGDHLQVEGLGVGHRLHPEAVDVGELVAGRVDGEVIGIAHMEHVGGGDLLVVPGLDARGVQVLDPEVAAAAALLPHRLHPVVVAFLLGQGVGVLVVLGVILGKVVLGIGVGVPAAPELVPARQRRERIAVVEPHREVVHLLGVRHRPPAVAPPAGRKLFEEQEVLEREHHVIRGVGVAVGPLHAAPQVHGHGLLVLGHLPALVDVGHDVDHVSRTAVGGLHGADQPADRRQFGVLGADRGRLEGPAVGADALEYVEHQRLFGQPFLYRRQLSRRHLNRQHRRLAELGDLVAGVLLVVLQGVPLPHVAVLGHHLGRRGGCLRTGLVVTARKRDRRRHPRTESDEHQLPSLSHRLLLFMKRFPRKVYPRHAPLSTSHPCFVLLCPSCLAAAHSP